VRSIIRLQPETSDGLNNGGFGLTCSGWGGVYQWCRKMVSMGIPLANNLQKFDIIIIHVDADVAKKNYQDANIKNPIKKDLPCVQPCPPASDTIQVLESVILGWLNLKGQLPHRFIMCIPSTCTEVWVAVALFGQSDASILDDIECNFKIENYLAQKPKKEKLIRNRSGQMKKLEKKYREKSGEMTNQWDYIIQKCEQAKKFNDDITSYW